MAWNNHNWPNIGPAKVEFVHGIQIRQNSSTKFDVCNSKFQNSNEFHWIFPSLNPKPISQGWPDLFTRGPNWKTKIVLRAAKKAEQFFRLFFLIFDKIMSIWGVSHQIYGQQTRLYICKSTLGAAKILWRATCGPRASVWPCLLFLIKIFITCSFDWRGTLVNGNTEVTSQPGIIRIY